MTRTPLILLALTLTCVTLLTCGPPSGLFETVGRLKALEQYGGAMVKLYGTLDTDRFVDVVAAGDSYYALGETDAYGNGTRDLVIVHLSREGFVQGTILFTSDDDLEAVALAMEFEPPEFKIVGVANVNAGGQPDVYVFRLSAATLGPDWDARFDDSAEANVPQLASNVIVQNDKAIIVGRASEGADLVPMIMRIDLPTGALEEIYYYDNAKPSRLDAVVNVGTQFLGVGGFDDFDTPGDGLIFEIDPSDLSISASVVDSGFGDSLTEVVMLPSGTVVLGGTIRGADWSTDGQAWWVSTTDSGLTFFESRGIWFDPGEPYDGLTGLSRASDEPMDSRFVVAGNIYDSILMNTEFSVTWAVQNDPDYVEIFGQTSAICPLDNGYMGFLHVGENVARPETSDYEYDADPEALAVWCLPDDGVSYPVTIGAASRVQMETLSLMLAAPPDAFAAPITISGTWDLTYDLEEVWDFTLDVGHLY